MDHRVAFIGMVVVRFGGKVKLIAHFSKGVLVEEQFLLANVLFFVNVERHFDVCFDFLLDSTERRDLLEIVHYDDLPLFFNAILAANIADLLLVAAPECTNDN